MKKVQSEETCFCFIPKTNNRIVKDNRKKHRPKLKGTSFATIAKKRSKKKVEVENCSFICVQSSSHERTRGTIFLGFKLINTGGSNQRTRVLAFQ